MRMRKLMSKANFNLINKPVLFVCLHIMFQISFQNFKGQKSYRKFFGVRSEILLNICSENKALIICAFSARAAYLRLYFRIYKGQVTCTHGAVQILHVYVNA